MPSPAVEATCDGAVAVPRAGKPCGKAGSMSRLCSKAFILPLDFLSTKLVINSQAVALGPRGIGPRGILGLLDVIASIRIVDGNGETALVELPGSEFEGTHATFVERVFPGDGFCLLK